MLRQTLGAAVLLWVLLFLPALLLAPREVEEEHPLLQHRRTQSLSQHICTSFFPLV